MNNLNKKIRVMIEKMYDELVALRHAIHENPELSNDEYKTAALVEKQLTVWGIKYARLPNSTAIIAEVKGNLDGTAAIGVRADMDALPIQEETDVAYISRNTGVMHACGHDIHTVNLLGTGYILEQLKNYFGGTVKLVFQPAEEIGAGAQKILDFGVLKNPPVKAFLAAHVSADIEVGQIQVKPEEMMLAASSFIITLTGRGGHASAPHQTDDIILAAAKLIIELQSISTRNLNYIEPAVLTVGSIHGGTRGNIIPKELVLEGTIRTQNNDLHEEIHNCIRKIINAQELITGVKGTAVFKLGSGAVYNDPILTKKFITVANEVIGSENVLIAKFPSNASEDFARFTRRVPSVFFRMGVNQNYLSKVEPIHSPKFIAADEALKTGIAVMTAAVLAFLQKESTRS